MQKAKSFKIIPSHNTKIGNEKFEFCCIVENLKNTDHEGNESGLLEVRRTIFEF